MILGEKKKGPKKGPSKKMFQGEKCSVCEDPGRFQNDLFFILDLFFIDYFQSGLRSTLRSIQCIETSFVEISQTPEPDASLKIALSLHLF